MPKYIQRETKTITSNYTISAFDDVLEVDTSSAAITITVPATSVVGIQATYRIVHLGSNLLTLQRSATDLLNSKTTLVSYQPGEALEISSTYTNNWIAISNFITSEKSLGFNSDLDTVRIVFFNNSTNIDNVHFDTSALDQINYQISTDGLAWTLIIGDQTTSGVPPSDLNTQCNAQVGFFYLKIIVTYNSAVNAETGVVLEYKSL